MALASATPPTRSAPPKKYKYSYRTLFEATFGLAMLDAWEIFMVYSALILLSGLLGMSIFYYLPQHINFLWRRGTYYVYGNESNHEFIESVGQMIGMVGSAKSSTGAAGGEL